LIYYDSNVYKIGFRKQNEIMVNCSHDVDSLNILQFLNCNVNIYFNQAFSIEHCKNIKQLCKKYNLDINKFQTIESKRENPDGTISILQQSFKEEIDCNLNLSFIKEIKKAKKYAMTGFAAELRKEEWRYNGFLDK